MSGITAHRDAPSGSAATLREIAQQPEVWREVQDLVERQRADLDGFLDELLQKDLRIVLTGAGTSAFIGSIAAPALSRSLRRRVDAVASTDIVSDPWGCFSEDVPTLLVSFARSGDSPESSSATRLADQVLTDVWHLIVTCNEDGELFRTHVGSTTSRVVLLPSRSNDEGFAMTSSYSSMLLATLLILGRRDDAALTATVRGATDVLDTRQDDIRALVATGFDRIVYLGSGPLAGLARESALKMLELTAGQVVSYHDSALGFRHGPKAVLNESTLVVIFVSSDPYTRRYDLDIVAELRGTMAQVIAISALPFEKPDPNSWHLVPQGSVPDEYASLVFAPVAQLLALGKSVDLGITADNPFPGGAVNRVVRGVTVYPFEQL